jgi:glutamate racemase
VDSATATASALAELLSVNGLEADSDGSAAPLRHRVLTTGDPGRFGSVAGRLFGSDFPDVESVELGVLA